MMLYETSGKKPSVAGKIARWTVYGVILFIYIFFMVRIIISCASSPSDTKKVTIEEVLDAAIEEKGLENLVAYKISSRSSFGGGDMLYLSDVVYIESASQLQFTVRFKRSRVAVLYKEFYTSQISDFKAVLKHTLNEAETVIQPARTTVYNYTDENTKKPQAYEDYFYIRYVFNGITLDYAKSQLYLDMHLTTEYNGPDKTEEMSAEPIEMNLIDTFTVFDVQTSKEKVSLTKFKFNRVVGN